MSRAPLRYIVDGKEGRWCNRCSVVKPMSEFYNSEHASYCKVCMSELDKQKRSKGSEGYAKQQLAKKKNNILKWYGVSWEDFLAVLRYQNYKCAICGKKLNATGDRSTQGEAANIDHNHETGKLRGILCINCNKLLGHCKDSIETLENAIKYLEIHKW